jgi:hypothetical protein
VKPASQIAAARLGDRRWHQGAGDCEASSAISNPPRFEGLAGRAAASKRPDFDLRSWHANALALGAHGLDRLAEELPRC